MPCAVRELMHKLINTMQSVGIINPLIPVVSKSYLVSPQVYGNLYGGFNTRHYTLVHGFCFF